VRSAVFTAVKIRVVVFWVVTPCSDVAGYQRLGGPYSLRFEMASQPRSPRVESVLLFIWCNKIALTGLQVAFFFTFMTARYRKY